MVKETAGGLYDYNTYFVVVTLAQGALSGVRLSLTYDEAREIALEECPKPDYDSDTTKPDTEFPVDADLEVYIERASRDGRPSERLCTIAGSSE